MKKVSMNLLPKPRRITKRLQKYVEYEISEAIKSGNSTTMVVAKVEDLRFLVELGYKVETISATYCRISW